MLVTSDPPTNFGVLLFFLPRRWIDLGNSTKAVVLSAVRARNEGPADLGRVPTRVHTKTQCLLFLDMPGREIFHWELSFDFVSMTCPLASIRRASDRAVIATISVAGLLRKIIAATRSASEAPVRRSHARDCTD